jgi:hypothetical protein
MKVYESQKRATKKWQSENYESIIIKVKKGEKAKIKAFCKSQDISLAGLIKSLLAREMDTFITEDTSSSCDTKTTLI